MKYTIELTDNQKNQMDLLCALAHQYIGFNPKLEKDIPRPMKESPAYKKGFEDGKKIADKDFEEIQDNTHDVVYMAYYNEALKDANHAIDVLEDMTVAEVKEWFEDCIGIDDVICEFTIQQIVKIIKTYEEEKKAEEIRVGDEVSNEYMTIIVTNIHDNDYFDGVIFDGVDFSGVAHPNRNSKLWNKTGRHFDEVNQLLSKLQIS